MKFLYNDILSKKQRRQLRENQTDAERLFWKYLRNKQTGVKFFRQYGIGPYILDFYSPKTRLAIELDGGQHAEKEARCHDEKRSYFLSRHNIKTIRFWNNDVLKNIEVIFAHIQEKITPPTSPYPKGRY